MIAACPDIPPSWKLFLGDRPTKRGGVLSGMLRGRIMLEHYQGGAALLLSLNSRLFVTSPQDTANLWMSLLVQIADLRETSAQYQGEGAKFSETYSPCRRDEMSAYPMCGCYNLQSYFPVALFSNTWNSSLLCAENIKWKSSYYCSFLFHDNCLANYWQRTLSVPIKCCEKLNVKV